MPPMRDAGVSGPRLREAHRRVGRYLATEYFGLVLGLEEYTIPHVSQSTTQGHRFLREDRTTIVALMRGGEPMAMGVSDALPIASFLHARDAVDVKAHHVQEQSAIVLVDSVINSGKSIVKFIEYIRQMHATIRIVIVAGVVQAGFVDDRKLEKYVNISLVALRLSRNKYVGTGTTDTGNRLLNTTYLD